MILRSTLIRAHNTVVSLHHEDALRQEKHVRATRQVNDGVMRSVLPMEWTEYLHSIGCILNGEWHMERGFPASFLEGTVKSHKVGLRR